MADSRISVPPRTPRGEAVRGAHLDPPRDGDRLSHRRRAASRSAQRDPQLHLPLQRRAGVRRAHELGHRRQSVPALFRHRARIRNARFRMDRRRRRARRRRRRRSKSSDAARRCCACRRLPRCRCAATAPLRRSARCRSSVLRSGIDVRRRRRARDAGRRPRESRDCSGSSAARNSGAMPPAHGRAARRVMATRRLRCAASPRAIRRSTPTSGTVLDLEARINDCRVRRQQARAAGARIRRPARRSPPTSPINRAECRWRCASTARRAPRSSAAARSTTRATGR